MRLYLFAVAAACDDVCPLSLLQLRHEHTNATKPMLRYEAGASPAVGIVGLGDNNFVQKYGFNVESMKCYAKKFGYDFALINPADDDYKDHCQQYKVFFFRKHCLVATFLQRKPPGYTAFVMDLDVLVMRSDLSLDHWAQGASESNADLVFYERIWNPEVMAGNYLARHSNFTLAFLQHWASYESRMPRGFSSTDNGAIHLALLDALDLSRKKCSDMYHRLHLGVDHLDLDDPNSEYWAFVRCTKEALHPPRRWQGKSGVITLLPRAHAWAVDGFVQGNQIAAHRDGPAFYHGIKNMDDSRKFFDLDACAARPDRIETEQHFTENFLNMLAANHGRGDERFLFTNEGPRECIKTLSCQPLSDDGGTEEQRDGFPSAGEFVSLAPVTALSVLPPDFPH